MNRQIVFFHQSSAMEHRMMRALEAGGMIVSPARSPAAMHNLFLRKLVSTVVFPHSMLEKYHIRIRSHLFEAKTPIAVVCWLQKEDGSIVTRIISIGRESLNEAVARENRHIASQTALLLRACRSPYTNHRTEDLHEPTMRYHRVNTLPEIPGMHRKMRLILEVLAASGDTGASPEHIIGEIWPGTEQERIHDLQSYISKIRKSLRNTSPLPMHILYQNRRYRLVQEKRREE